MTSKLDICQRALLSIGSRAGISSIEPSDGSVEANACTVLFSPTYEQLARTAQWDCLRSQLGLTLLAAAQGTPENPDGTLLPQPPQPWLYSYVYPADCLQLRWLVPSLPSTTGDQPPQTTLSNSSPTWLPTGGQIPYAVSYAPDPNNSPTKIILTNQSQAQAVYTINQPNPQTWDSLFQQAMVASLGAFLVPALSLSLPLMQVAIKTAEMAIVQARTADANEGVTTMDHVPDWFQARAGASGYGWTWGWSNWNGGYSDMCWPSGYY